MSPDLVDNLEVTSTDTNEVSLAWDLLEDVDDVDLYRARTDWEDGQGDLIADLPADAETHTDDDGLVPDREYRYTVVATKDSDEDEDQVLAETDSAGYAQRAIPPRGWLVELDHPDGQTVRPQVLDRSRLEPQLLDQPRARVAVPPDSGFDADAFEGAELSVFVDGTRQPIDELEDVELAPDHDELVGVGATQLERRVRRDVRQAEAPTLVESLIQDETDYVADVDDPTGEVDDGVLVGDADTAAEWETLLQTLAETSPALIDDETDRLRVAQTCFTVEAEDADSGDWHESTDSEWDNPDDVPDTDDFSDGEGAFVESATHQLNYEFTTEHTIPAGEFWPSFRHYVPDGADDDGNPEFDIELISGPVTGEVATVPQGGLVQDGQFRWQIDQTDSFDQDMPPGTYTVQFNIDPSVTGVGEMYFDVVAPQDQRFSYTHDNELDEPAGHLDGPEFFPALVTVSTEPLPQFRTAVAGRVDVDAGTAGELAEIEFSANNGGDWQTATDTDELDASIPEAEQGVIVRVRLGLGRSDDPGREATPLEGTVGHEALSVDIEADFSEAPLVINRLLEDDLASVLTDIAELTDSVWAAEQDGDDTVISWTRPGDRQADASVDVGDYTVRKAGGRVLRCTVIGANARVREETLEGDVGEAVALAEANVIRGKEVVRSEDDGTHYREGVDYEIDAGAGELVALEGGDIDDGETLEIDYDHQVRASWEHPDYAGDERTSIVERIPAAASERTAEQAAKRIVDEASTPRWETDLVLPWDQLQDVSLVEALTLEGVPGTAEVVYDVTRRPDGLELRLGSRDRVSETVGRIQDQLRDATELV